MTSARPQAVARRLVFVLALIGDVVANAPPPELDGCRLGDYRAPTPKTVAGGMVLDTKAADALRKSGDNRTALDFDLRPRRSARITVRPNRALL